MKYLFIFLIFFFNIAFSDTKALEDDYFYIGKMDSYNKDFNHTTDWKRFIKLIFT